jgi:hypothetical protein
MPVIFMSTFLTFFCASSGAPICPVTVITFILKRYLVYLTLANNEAANPRANVTQQKYQKNGEGIR